MIEGKETGCYPICYAAFSEDRELRKLGTSGAMFAAIAVNVLKAGGVVCAAAYADGIRSVKHVVIDKINDLPRLCGSKYVESDCTEAFRKCRELLSNGRMTFFVGTPCQVAAINKLTNCPQNLLTADLVCHGVPTNDVWRSYLDYEVKRNASDVVGCIFRNKSKGWNLSHTTLTFNDGSQKDSISGNNAYMAAFYAGLSLRQTCLSCRVAKGIRVGDFTLGDCWHVSESHPEMDDNGGTSLLLVNTEKGRQLFDELMGKGSIKVEPYSLEIAYANNSALIRPATVDSVARETFLAQVNSGRSDFWDGMVSVRTKLRNIAVYFAKWLFCKLNLPI